MWLNRYIYNLTSVIYSLVSCNWQLSGPLINFRLKLVSSMVCKTGFCCLQIWEQKSTSMSNLWTGFWAIKFEPGRIFCREGPRHMMLLLWGWPRRRGRGGLSSSAPLMFWAIFLNRKTIWISGQWVPEASY